MRQSFPLQVHELQCERGGEVIFTAMDFALASGDCLQAVGANGSGKTALLRVLAGLLPVEQGQLRVPKDYLLVGHETGIKKQLTPVEHLQIMTGLHRTSVTLNQIREVLKTVGLFHCDDKYNGQLSMGQQRRLALAVLLLVPASLWLLDEPLSYLDKEGQALLCQLIRQHLQQGGLCIFSSHQPVELDGLVVQTLFLEDYQWQNQQAGGTRSPFFYGMDKAQVLAC